MRKVLKHHVFDVVQAVHLEHEGLGDKRSDTPVQIFVGVVAQVLLVVLLLLDEAEGHGLQQLPNVLVGYAGAG